MLGPLSLEGERWARRGAREADAAGGYVAGNRLVSATSAALRREVVAYDAEEIDIRAQSNARRCMFLSDAQALAFVREIGAREPAGPGVTADGIRRRVRDRGWWRRQLRAVYGRRAENAYRDLGRVHRHADPYLTTDGLRRHYQQRAQALAFLKSHDVACEQTGELFPLDEIAARSLAAADVRRAEFMARVRGFEEHAAECGHTWAFFTLTAPSAYHPRLARSGAANPRYTGATVREARDLLQRLWSRVRAKVKRLALAVYGFRIAEPHHDGTPHWHLLMFGAAADLGALWEAMRGHWFSVNREELDGPAAYEARAKRVDPDPSRGTAAGYVAKYVSKGIDGHALDGDDPAETDLSGVDASVRVEAWARLHGIRQFQQIGGPRVGIYRELRRVREPIEADPDLEAARLAADAGEFALYMRAAEGLGLELDKAPPRAVDHAGRSVLRLTQWGEIPADRVIGLRRIGPHGRIIRLATRPFSWRRVRRLSSLGPVAITVRTLEGGKHGGCSNQRGGRAVAEARNRSARDHGRNRDRSRHHRRCAGGDRGTDSGTGGGHHAPALLAGQRGRGGRLCGARDHGGG